MDEPYHIGFIADETPDVRALHKCCLDCGLTTTHDGRTDMFREYSVELDLHQDEDPTTALAALKQAKSGTLHYWTETDMKLSVGFTNPTSEREEWWGRTSVGFQTVDVGGMVSKDAIYRERIDEVTDLVRALVPLVDPEFIWSCVSDGSGRRHEVKPDGRPISDHINEIPWITAFSESTIEEFGGREHVRATPAWSVDELDNGSIVLVKSEWPWQDATRDHPVDDHLLGD